MYTLSEYWTSPDFLQSICAPKLNGQVCILQTFEIQTILSGFWMVKNKMALITIPNHKIVMISNGILVKMTLIRNLEDFVHFSVTLSIQNPDMIFFRYSDKVYIRKPDRPAF